MMRFRGEAKRKTLVLGSACLGLWLVGAMTNPALAATDAEKSVESPILRDMRALGNAPARRTEQPKAVFIKELHANVLPFSFNKFAGNAETGTAMGPCPWDLGFSGGADFSGAGTVRYRWKRNDGVQGPILTGQILKAPVLTASGEDRFVFAAETYWWRIAKNYSGWVALEILEPGHKISEPVPFTLKCVDKKEMEVPQTGPRR